MGYKFEQKELDLVSKWLVKKLKYKWLSMQ